MPAVNYNDFSRVYDDVREGDVALINRFLKEIQAIGTFNALEIGCGTGNYTNLFQKLTQAHVYGIDPSEGMLSKARQKNGRCNREWPAKSWYGSQKCNSGSHFLQNRRRK